MNGVHIRDFDFDQLMSFVQTAKGDVFLSTAEGDVLNLKSQLTQLLVLSGALSHSTVADATVECQCADDECRLFRMNLYREP